MKKSIKQQIATKKKEIAILEEKLSKEVENSTPKNIWETITSLPGIYKWLKRDPKKDIIKIHTFSKKDHDVLRGVIERMSVSKVFTNNKPLGMRGVKRWYPWSTVNSLGSGLIFHRSDYNDHNAHLNSASRLSFPCEAASDAYFKNFKKTEEKIIGL